MRLAILRTDDAVTVNKLYHVARREENFKDLATSCDIVDLQGTTEENSDVVCIGHRAHGKKTNFVFSSTELYAIKEGQFLDGV